MRVCPVNINKILIRNLLTTIFDSTRKKNVFSLIGTDAGFVSQLSKKVNVVSSEYDREVYKYQTSKFPKYDLNLGKAQDTLCNYYNHFDLIWLDFYGSMTAPSNIPAMAMARTAVHKDGYVAITSGLRGSKDVKFNVSLKNCGLNCIKSISYLNNGTRMYFYLCTVN